MQTQIETLKAKLAELEPLERDAWTQLKAAERAEIERHEGVMSNLIRPMSHGWHDLYQQAEQVRFAIKALEKYGSL